jgi:hypothetical protein
MEGTLRMSNFKILSIFSGSVDLLWSTSDLLPNPAKVPNFLYKPWWYFIVQKFHNDGKKFQESQFRSSKLYWLMVIIRPKSQKFKIGREGILSIENFRLMIKNHILLFQLPGNWPTTKKCTAYFRGNTEFPIYFILYISILWQMWAM